MLARKSFPCVVEKLSLIFWKIRSKVSAVLFAAIWICHFLLSQYHLRLFYGL